MKWKVAIVFMLAVLLLASTWAYHHRSEAVYDRIIHQRGYVVSLVKEHISSEFFLRPEWIPERNGDEKQLNLVIDDKFGTKIILEKIGKRERDFFIQLNAIPYPNRKLGQLLLTSFITPDGSFTTSGNFDRWVVTDPAGQDILHRNFGTGNGPGNISSIFIDDPYRDKFEQGAYVRFSGYNLYGYQQLDGELETYWIPILFLGLLLVLVALYRRRSVQENWLGWKLVGYLFLGGFTLSINEVKLPLGFTVYLLLFRKLKPNSKIKNKAALLGLLVYVSQLLVPAFAGMVDWHPREMAIRNVSIEQLGMDGVWKTVTAQAPVSKQAKLLSYEMVLSSRGEVLELTFRLVERDEGRFIHTDAVYDVQEQILTLKRSSTDQWLQYNRQISAEHFFARVVELHLMNLRSAGDHPYVKLELMEDGTPVNYGIKEGHKFGVDEKGVYEIVNEQLPVTGNWISACGFRVYAEHYSGCEDRVDYLFDIVGEGRWDGVPEANQVQ
ncbi:hypothetical protein VN24_00995 [Paenibacillus beijingensis]|uniref:Uncharacterized protein n=1 Tax=Paenibacillus beijingensis TaxID=1126833 RepID=A0A0D5NDI6_9BACL|nr:hypothetical protein [Paenibacillus beijingensis]AJY73459.1 hypothetical protein VN24_00995 [Paenibacillus beijingensis]